MKHRHHKCIPRHTHTKVPNMLACMHSQINIIGIQYVSDMFHPHDAVAIKAESTHKTGMTTVRALEPIRRHHHAANSTGTASSSHTD